MPFNFLLFRKGCVNILDERLTNHLQKIRWDREWSQTTLSRRSGVPQSTITAIENNERIPSVVIALKLADALSLKVEDIFTL